VRGIAKTVAKRTFCLEEEEDPATCLRALLARKLSAETRESGTQQDLQKQAKGRHDKAETSVQRNLSQISCVHHHSARESILRTNLEAREPDAIE
jgi:hypothetical protein